MARKGVLILMIFLSFLLLFSSNDLKIHIPQLLSYELEVEFYPEAQMDYAGFIGILYGWKPDWNKEDSTNHYPYMKGEAKIWIDFGRNLRSILDFYIHSELRVHRIQLEDDNLEFDQKPVFYPHSYSQVATKITVKLNGVTGKHRFLMVYGGMFNPCYAASPSDYMRIDRQGVYLRSFGYSLWFPVLWTSNDDIYPVDFDQVKINTPKKFVSVFTGERISDIVKDCMRTSLWKGNQISPWDAQITVRPYEIMREKGIFLYHLNHPRSLKVSKDILAFIRQLLAFYSEHYREVESASQLHVAELPNFASGISSGNMIGMTSGQWRRFSLSDDDTDMELLVSHELVHSFVQLNVDTSMALDPLVIEGFPSYFHLPALANIFGEEWYQKYIRRVEASYLQKKETGKNHRGMMLPVEKPILSLTFDDISRYKDTFVLNDRVRLFLNYIREKSGIKQFKNFTQELFGSRNLTLESFIKLIGKYVPDCEPDVRIWLESIDYPERFRLQN